MGKRDRIVALAVRETELKEELARVQADLDELLSNRKKTKKRKGREGVQALTAQQQGELAGKPLPHRILTALEAEANSGKAFTVAEIAELIGPVNENSVRGILSRMKNSGSVRNVGRGLYAASSRSLTK